MGVQLDGMKEIQDRIAEVGKQIMTNLDGGLEAGAAKLLEESKPLVPVVTGKLHDSGFSRRAKDGVVEVGYGEDYALQVHENLELHHPNGGPKYLERPAREHADELFELIAKDTAERTA